MSTFNIRNYKITYEAGSESDTSPRRKSYISMKGNTYRDSDNNLKIHFDYITYYSHSYILGSSIDQRNKMPLCVLLTFCNQPTIFQDNYHYELSGITGSVLSLDDYYNSNWSNRIPTWFTSGSNDYGGAPYLVSGQSVQGYGIFNGINNNTYYRSTTSVLGNIKNNVIEIARYVKDDNTPSNPKKFSLNQNLFGTADPNAGSYGGYRVNQTTFPGVGKWNNSLNGYYIYNNNPNDGYSYSRVLTISNVDYEIGNTNVNEIYPWINLYSWYVIDVGHQEPAWNGWNGTIALGSIPSEEYSVVYHENGGNPSSVPSSQTKYQGTDLTLSSVVPTRPGYTFINWNTKSDGSGTSYNAGGTYSLDNSIDLYAQWSRVTYTVTYNSNSGSSVVSGLPSPQTKYETVSLQLDDSIPTRSDGYNFISWNTSQDGTGVSYNPGGTYSADSDCILYAQWSRVTYTITYNSNGGDSSSVPDPQTKYKTVNLTLSSEVPTRYGYSFISWNTKSDGTGTSYSPGGIYSNDSGNATLYAQWNSSSDIWEYYGSQWNLVDHVWIYDGIKWVKSSVKKYNSGWSNIR